MEIMHRLMVLSKKISAYQDFQKEKNTAINYVNYVGGTDLRNMRQHD